MSTDTSSLQKLQEAFTSIPAGSPGGDCPDPDRLCAAVRLELPPEERREIVRHTAVCAACAEDWRVSWAFWKKEQESDGNGSGGKVLNGPWRAFKKSLKKSLPQVAAAGLVLAAVGVGGWLFQDAAQPDAHRSGRSLAPASAATELLTDEGAVFAKDQVRLAWTPGPEGSRYKVEILTLDGQLLFSAANLTDPRLEVPADELAQTSSTGELYWQVTWFAPSSTATVTAGPRLIRIR